MKILVPQHNVHPRRTTFLPFIILANVTITSMLFFIVLMDIVSWCYQEIYFSISGIPKIKRSTYVVMTRHTLQSLTLLQKWSCWYCEYTNGVITWMKALANQTETYSCAIKYSHGYPGLEYQENFYEQEPFTLKK